MGKFEKIQQRIDRLQDNASRVAASRGYMDPLVRECFAEANALEWALEVMKGDKNGKV